MVNPKSVFSFLLFLSVILTGLHASGGFDTIPEEIERGVVDLREGLEDKKVLKLTGEWAFYDGQLLDPEEPLPQAAEYKALPGAVLFSNGRFGYGTLVLKIWLPKDSEHLYGIFFPGFISAYEIFIDGTPVIKAGTVGTARNEEQKDSYSTVVPIKGKLNEPVIVMIHNSNYNELSAGTRERIFFGKLQAVQNYRSFTNYVSIGLIGSFIMIGFYHILFFLFRKREKTSLYSSLFSFFIAKRILLVNLADQLDLFPFFEHIPHILQRRIEYFGFYSLVFIFIMFYFHIFLDKRSRIFKNITILFTVLTIIPVFTMPFHIFNNLLVVNQVYTFLCGIYITIDLVYRSVRKSREAQFLLLSFLFLYAAVTIDSLGNRFVFMLPPLTPVGYYFFVFIQGLVLSRKYALAFNDVEIISVDLNRFLSERKSYEKLLEAKVQERTEDLSLALVTANRANSEKGEFLARMSHEIRTPLNGIMGFAEIIHDSKTKKDKNRFAHLVIRESENLLNLINQLLDISKIDAGEMVLEKKPEDINILIQETIDNYLYIIEEKGLKLALDIPEFENLFVVDALRFKQALSNIIGNSCKFTEKGEIRFSATKTFENEQRAELLFIIRDTGIGIPKDKQDVILKGFQQADSAITRKFSGTGLGTTISKSLIEMIGGTMGFESTDGSGSYFWFRLPLEKIKKTSWHKENKKTSKDVKLGLEVLLVEDYPANQLVARRHLEKAGCIVDLAENGQVAVDKAKEKKYDVICMDLHMPIMDGYEATSQIRKLENRNDTIIIGLTADAYEETKSRCLEFGMNDVITKPLRRKNFLEVVAQWTGKKN